MSKHKCYYCDRTFSTTEPGRLKTKDHIIPLIEGGSNADINITPACATCNTFKASLIPEEFLAKVKRWLHANRLYKDLTVEDMRMIVYKVQVLIEKVVDRRGDKLYKTNQNMKSLFKSNKEVIRDEAGTKQTDGYFGEALFAAKAKALQSDIDVKFVAGFDPHVEKGTPVIMHRPDGTHLKGGLRFDSGKTRHDLVPPFAQEQYARVLTAGANKYADRNWERGMAWSKVIGPLKRHILAIERGEDYDPETGELHAAHVMCNAAFLTEYYKIHPQGDDRPHNYLRPKKIGLDIDEVLCDWVSAWCKLYNHNIPSSWYFDGKIVERFNAMRENGTLNAFYLDLKPKVKPQDIPFEPHCYVTARPVETSVTETWLRQHGFPVRPVYTVPAGESKVDVVKQAGCDIFVDDSFRNFQELNNAGICCYLYDAPHNQRYNVGHKRIKSLKALV